MIARYPCYYNSVVLTPKASVINASLGLKPPLKKEKLGKESYTLTFFTQLSRPSPGDQLKTLRSLNTEQSAFLTIFCAQVCEKASLILRLWLW